MICGSTSGLLLEFSNSPLGVSWLSGGGDREREDSKEGDGLMKAILGEGAANSPMLELVLVAVMGDRG